MPTKRENEERFETRMIPVHVRKESVKEKPFVVAFETSDGYRAGQRVTEDEFYRILDYYESVIVHRREGSHPSQEDCYLLYCEACDIGLSEDDVEVVGKRKRSKEIAGRFRWFFHGKGRNVDLSIGLHCLDDELWDELP